MRVTDHAIVAPVEVTSATEYASPSPVTDRIS